jgi:hypothetical protein
MTTRDFCFWLQGFFEMDKKGLKKSEYNLSHQQIQSIQDHLNLVFAHDPVFQREITKVEIKTESKQDFQDMISKMGLQSGTTSTGVDPRAVIC